MVCLKVHENDFQENFNALHLASTYAREDVIKVLLAKKGVDVYSSGGVCYSILISIIIRLYFCLSRSNITVTYRRFRFKAQTTDSHTHGGEQANGYGNQHTPSASGVLWKRHSDHRGRSNLLIFIIFVRVRTVMHVLNLFSLLYVGRENPAFIGRGDR